jgi:hypothetical protein
MTRADLPRQPDAGRRRSLTPPPTGGLGDVSTPDDSHPPTSAPTRSRQPVSPPLAEYDPSWYDRLTPQQRGIPTDWPWCKCDSPRCPDGQQMTPEQITASLAGSRLRNGVQDAA